MSWVPILLGVGFAITAAVLLLELSRGVDALETLPRRLRGWAVVPREKWCRAGSVDDACAARDSVPSVSFVARLPTRRTATERPPRALPSRPGELVRPELYSIAPPLPGDGLIDTHRYLPSIEVDIDELIDTQPSLSLTADEAAHILDDGFDRRATQRR